MSNGDCVPADGADGYVKSVVDVNDVTPGNPSHYSSKAVYAQAGHVDVERFEHFFALSSCKLVCPHH